MDLRLRHGTLEIEAADDVPAGASRIPAVKPRRSLPARGLAIAEGRIGDGTLRIADEAVSPAFRVTCRRSPDGKKIASNAGRGTFDASFDSTRVRILRRTATSIWLGNRPAAIFR
jgi:hypothetical protein